MNYRDYEQQLARPGSANNAVADKFTDVYSRCVAARNDVAEEHKLDVYLREQCNNRVIASRNQPAVNSRKVRVLKEFDERDQYGNKVIVRQDTVETRSSNGVRVTKTYEVRYDEDSDSD